MDQFGSKIKNISSDLKEYLETRINLIVLNVGDQITQWVGHSIQKIIGLTILGCGLLFVFIAIAIYLGELLNNEAIGFLIVSAPLLLLGIIFLFIKPVGLAKTIQGQLMSGILDAIDEKKDDTKLVLKERNELVQNKENE